jgi:hypothetical protein
VALDVGLLDECTVLVSRQEKISSRAIRFPACLCMHAIQWHESLRHLLSHSLDADWHCKFRPNTKGLKIFTNTPLRCLDLYAGSCTVLYLFMESAFHDEGTVRVWRQKFPLEECH